MNSSLVQLQSSADRVQANITAVKNSINQTLSDPKCQDCTGLSEVLKSLTVDTTIDVSTEFVLTRWLIPVLLFLSEWMNWFWMTKAKKLKEKRNSFWMSFKENMSQVRPIYRQRISMSVGFIIYYHEEPGTIILCNQTLFDAGRDNVAHNHLWLCLNSWSVLRPSAPWHKCWFCSSLLPPCVSLRSDMLLLIKKVCCLCLIVLSRLAAWASFSPQWIKPTKLISHPKSTRWVTSADRTASENTSVCWCLFFLTRNVSVPSTLALVLTRESWNSEIG